MFRGIPDKIYMRSLVLVSCILFVSNLSANPFETIEESLKEFLDANYNLAYPDSKETKIRTLFSAGISGNPETEDSSDGESLEPKHVRYSTFLSSTIIHEKAEILKKHIVKGKETLRSIAKLYKVTIAKLKKKNRFEGDKLKTGQVVLVPIEIKNAKTYKVTKKRIFISPLPGGRVTSGFGGRRDPFNNYYSNFHTGMDFGASVGTPIVASGDGEVLFTGRNGGYGNTVIIQHKNGFKTVYAHCSKILVESGDLVKMGRVVALVGRTGTATGAHLHFEVLKNGRLMNPGYALSMYEKSIVRLDNEN